MTHTPSTIRIKPTISIREKVREAIRNDIYEGRITEGTRLVEARLAKQIKTSRTPVREALHMLEMEGLLESIPRVGYMVKPIKWEELEELCEIRSVNETLAARWAMKRITSKELKALEKIIKAMEQETLKGNPKNFWDHDAKFHESIARYSGSKRLLELCRTLRRHMVRYRIQTLFLEQKPLLAITKKSIKAHSHILECIRKKDSTGVEKAIKNHLDETKMEILRYALKNNKGTTNET
jgi:GntR family transcriptional regulator, rspAB operon transcriptional repressor